MINQKIFEENEECQSCGGNFNKHFNLCIDCKSRDNTGKSNNISHKHLAIEYREGDLNNHHIVMVTVESSQMGVIKLIVPYNSQIANRVQYYIDNGIRDFLEEGLLQEHLITFSEFTKMSINSENYFVLKTLLL